MSDAAVPSDPRPPPAGGPRADPACDLSVVIVNYNSGEHLRRCLGSLETALVPLDAEVVVVDNASSDGSADGIEDLPARPRLLRSRMNLGFARACNEAVARSTGRLVFFLNPDASVSSDSLIALHQAAVERPRAGVIGSQVLNPDGTIQPSCRIVPSLGVALGHALLGFFWRSNPFTRRYLLSDWDHAHEREVDWVSGSAMLVRREAFEEVGGFDERYFMYVEDLDLCDRMQRAGWKIFYYPHAAVVHHIGASTRRSPYRMILEHHRSAWIYWWSRARSSPRVLLSPLVAAVFSLRLLATCIHYFASGLGTKGREGAPSP